MSRFAILVIGAAMMLVVAACATDDDVDDADTAADDNSAVVSNDNGADDATIDDPEEDDNTGDFEIVEPEGDDAVDPDGVPTQPEVSDPMDQPGMFFDLTFEEADEMTDFDLKQPAELPDGIQFQMIVGMASPTATEEEIENEEVASVAMMLVKMPEDPDEMAQGMPIEFSQSTESMVHENIPPDAEQETITIGDREITRVLIPDMQTGEQIIGYLWVEDGVFFTLATFLAGDLEESDLQAIVEAIPAS